MGITSIFQEHSMPRSAKQQAAEMIRDLPDQATWDDIMYELYVRQKIEQGLRDGDEGRLVSQEEVERLFLGQ
jgi:predicted transcriptional regulator